MTEPVVTKKEKFEITFPAEKAQSWSMLAYLVLQKKYSKLGSVIEDAFDVSFEKPTSSNPISSPITSISFWATPETKDKVMKTLDILFEDHIHSRHFARMTVEDIARQLNETGTYVRKAFNTESAANNNRPAAAKRPDMETPAQREMRQKVTDHDLTFAMGPAGTGKTHVAMDMAIEALKSGKVKKILLARPATEAGEKIGFLPGDQNAKLDPYMRPLYDELDKTFGPNKYKKMVEDKVIEIVPVGYMRGRTFEDAFIVIDEAQNCDFEQLKMAVTRIGFGSKMVITGDPNQVDLKPASLSGLAPFVNLLEGKPGIAVQRFEEADCVRSPIVKTIVEALRENMDDMAPAAQQKQGVKRTGLQPMLFQPKR